MTELVEAVLAASRALVGVAVESLAEVGEDITLPQYRALIVLAGRAPLTLGALAEALHVNPSTASRLCDRMVERRLVERELDEGNRRQVRLTISPQGRNIVEVATARRRTALARILRKVPQAQRVGLVGALRAFNQAAGDAPEQPWAQASIL